jgi:hypothetical protein
MRSRNSRFSRLSAKIDPRLSLLSLATRSSRSLLFAAKSAAWRRESGVWRIHRLCDSRSLEWGNMGLSRVLQGCYKGVTRVLQGCYKGVTRVLQGCYKGVSVTRVLQGCNIYKGVTRVLQGCYKGVTKHVIALVCEDNSIFGDRMWPTSTLLSLATTAAVVVSTA